MSKTGMFQTCVNLPVYANGEYGQPADYLMKGDIVVILSVGTDEKPLPFDNIATILTGDSLVGEIPYYASHWRQYTGEPE
jgi:hypothetical protein